MTDRSNYGADAFRLLGDSQTAIDLCALEWTRADWRVRCCWIENRVSEIARVLAPQLRDTQQKLIPEHLHTLQIALHAVLDDQQPVDAIDLAIGAIRASVAAGRRAEVDASLERLRRCVAAVLRLTRPAEFVEADLLTLPRP